MSDRDRGRRRDRGDYDRGRDDGKRARREDDRDRRDHDSERHSSPAAILEFRVVVQADKVGRLLGVGGSIVRRIRGTTGAQMHVKEPPSRDERERIVAVFSESTPNRPTCPAQEALALVAAHLLEEETPQGLMPPPGEVSFRFLIDNQYVGNVLGQRGSVISETRQTCGCIVKVWPRDRLPRQASPDREELIEIAGPYARVRHALDIVAGQVRESVIRKSGLRGPPPGPPGMRPLPGSPLPAARPLLPPAAAAAAAGPAPAASALPAGPKPTVTVEFQLLVPEKCLEAVAPFRAVNEVSAESKATVQVDDFVAGSNSRVLRCLSEEPPVADNSPALHALMRFVINLVDHVERIMRGVPVVVWLMLQPGMLATLTAPPPPGAPAASPLPAVSQVMRETGAAVSPLPRAATPACVAPEHDVLVIEATSGKQVKDAVKSLAIAMRLKMVADFTAQQAALQAAAAAAAAAAAQQQQALMLQQQQQQQAALMLQQQQQQQQMLQSQVNTLMHQQMLQQQQQQQQHYAPGMGGLQALLQPQQAGASLQPTTAAAGGAAPSVQQLQQLSSLLPGLNSLAGLLGPSVAATSSSTPMQLPHMHMLPMQAPGQPVMPPPLSAAATNGGLPGAQQLSALLSSLGGGGGGGAMPAPAAAAPAPAAAQQPLMPAVAAPPSLVHQPGLMSAGLMPPSSMMMSLGAMLGQPAYGSAAAAAAGAPDAYTPAVGGAAFQQQLGQGSNGLADADGGGGYGGAPGVTVGANGEERRTVIITAKQARSLMSNRGGTLNGIRHISRTDIKLYDDPLPGGDRRLALAGQPEQVKAAMDLIYHVLQFGDLPA